MMNNDQPERLCGDLPATFSSQSLFYDAGTTSVYASTSTFPACAFGSPWTFVAVEQQGDNNNDQQHLPL